MSYLVSGRILGMIYTARRLPFKSRSPFLFECTRNKVRRLRVVSVPSVCLGFAWGSDSQTKYLPTWNGGSNFFFCWSDVTWSLKADNPDLFKTLLQWITRSLISLLVNNPFEFNSMGSWWALKQGKRNSTREKKTDKKQCCKKEVELDLRLWIGC